MIPVVESECVIPFSEISLDTVLRTSTFGTVRNSNPHRSFCFRQRGSDRCSCRRLCGMHLKLTFSYGGQDFPQCFSARPRRIFDFAVGDTVDMVFSMSENFFNNRYSLNMSISVCDFVPIPRERVGSGSALSRFRTAPVDCAALTRKDLLRYTDIFTEIINFKTNQNICRTLLQEVLQEGFDGFDFCKLMLCLRYSFPNSG